MSEPDREEQERLARELEEQLKALRVEDVVVQSLVTVSSIGFRRLGLSQDTRDDRDLPQSQLAIETLDALGPVLERFMPEQLAEDFKQSAAQLKLAYVRAMAEDEAGAGGEATEGGDDAGSGDAEPADAEETGAEASGDAEPSSDAEPSDEA